MKNLIYTLLLIACTISTATYAQKLDGKTVILENYSDGNVLTLDSLSTGTSNPRVFTWDNEVNSPCQQWKFTATGDEDNTYFITSTYSYNNTANYLEVSHSEVGKNGGKVFLSKPNGGFSSSTGANQVWIVNQSADGYYNFTSAHATGKGAYALELSGNDMGKNGGRIQIWWNKGYKNQKWKLINVGNTTPVTKQSDDTEIVNGIREVLILGIQKQVTKLVKPGGFSGNPLVKLSFPEDLLKVEKTLRDVGMGSSVDKGIKMLNLTAEDAVKNAMQIIIDASKEVDVNNPKNIIAGADNAITAYFMSKSKTSLYSDLLPIVNKSFVNVGAAQSWATISSQYNKIPFMQKVDFNMTEYITQKAIEGVFTMIAIEEKNIRNNTSSQTTDLLKKVFSLQD